MRYTGVGIGNSGGESGFIDQSGNHATHQEQLENSSDGHAGHEKSAKKRKIIKHIKIKKKKLKVVSRWMRRKKTPEGLPGIVTVTSLNNGWCTGQNMAHERAKRAAAEFGEKVVFNEIDTTDATVMRDWGMDNALFIDSKEVRTGPPPTYQKLHKLIAKRLRAL